MDPALKKLLSNVHEEIQSTFYGCGSPFPLNLKDQTVLDLGVGSGRDCYLLSQLVGENGKVIGVDMTEEQLNIARKHEDYHAQKFGYKKPNTHFKQGYIEDIKSIGIADNSIDLVVSNCVINLSPNKERVFAEIFRVLKPGGELYFSDVFTDRRLPNALKNDEVFRGECLGGALYVEDFRRLLYDLSCKDYRIMSSRVIAMRHPEMQKKAGLTRFFSITIRAFKLPLEDRCEDFGQVATYLGTIDDSPNSFTLDDHHLFEKDRPMLVCGNTAMMLQKTRYQKYFKIEGDTQGTHFGLFDCSPVGIESDNQESSSDDLANACC